MKLTISQPVLSAAINTALPAVSTRSTLPVLGNLLLETKDNTLRIVATNMEISLQVWCECNTVTEGAVTIPATLISQFVRQLPAQDVTLALNAKNVTLSLSCGGYSAKIKGIDAADFPTLPPLEGTEFVLPDLGWIPQVIFAASTDISRPALNGVELVAKDGTITAAATDGYRLAIRTVQMDCEPFALVVPSTSLRQLSRIATPEPVTCVVPPEQNQILFALVPADKHLQQVQLTSRLVDARFPDYRAIIPKSHERAIQVSAADLRNAVQVARLFARDDSEIVKLCIDGERLVVEATSNEMGDSRTELIAKPLDGTAPLEIHFNSKYLLEYLAVVEGDVVLETTQATRPGLLRVAGDDAFMHVIMPMHPPREKR